MRIACGLLCAGACGGGNEQSDGVALHRCVVAKCSIGPRTRVCSPPGQSPR